MNSSVAHLCRCAFAILVVCLVSGCGTLPNDRRWGQDATLLPGMERLRTAAVRAATSPGTWIPAAGALAFSIEDLDEKTSAWAVKHNPVFGSTDSAMDASNDLVDGLEVWMILTALSTPSGRHPFDWTTAKAKGLLVEHVALEIAALDLNMATTEYLKTEVGRTRPDGSDDRSFPSGHTADAFGAATLATRNLEYINMPRPARRSLQAATMATAAGTGWARVEANKHYPSDVLAAAALANFLTAFIHDAFLGVPPDDQFFGVAPDENGLRAQFTWRF